MARTHEEYLKAKREGMARLRARDPDAARRKQLDWHRRNREHNTQKMRDYYARRFFWGRAMKLRGPGRATYQDLARMWKAQRGRCALTGRRLDRTAEVDHILPKVKGGGDEAGNLRWVCREANLAKRDLTDAEFLALCQSVTSCIGARIQWVEDHFGEESEVRGAVGVRGVRSSGAASVPHLGRTITMSTLGTDETGASR